MAIRWKRLDGECLICANTEGMYYRKAADNAHLVQCQSQWEGPTRESVRFAANVMSN